MELRKKNVQEIRRLIQERKQAVKTYSSLTQFLISKGIAQAIAEEITLHFTEHQRELSSLKEILAEHVKTTGDLDFTKQKKLALVGPTGVGKTTILLKLADYYRREKRIACVTLDQEKGGAFAQLERYASKWEIPIYEEMESFEDYDLILIDTGGCNFYQPNRIDIIGDQLAECGEVEIVLALSAGAKDVDLYGAIHQFSPLRPTSLAFTKLDETLAAGVLINVSKKTELPIRYIAYGYPLPGEVQIADPYKIIHKILTDMNQEEFQLLRQITMC